MSKQSRRPSRRNRERTPRRRGQPPKLNLTVVTYPDSSNGLSLRREVDAVRAALLYADTVELISLGTVMLASAVQLGQVNEAGMIAFISSLDDSTLATMTGADALDPGFRPALAVAAAALQAPQGTHPVVDELSNLIQQGLGAGMSELRTTTEQMYADSGLDDIAPAIDAGIVELSHAGMATSGNTDESLANWVDLLTRRLRDRDRRILLDEQVTDLVAAMIREDRLQLPSLSLQHTGEARVGTGLIARLPVFPDAPTDELLDLRSDLDGPLSRYRGAVAKLAKDAVSPDASGLVTDADVGQVWVETVSPALVDLRDGFAEHTLVREIASRIGANLRAVVDGGIGSGIWIGLDQFTSLNAWVSAVAAAALPTADLVAGARTAQRSAHADLSGHELFYLYEVDRRLSGI